jgi:hypothetical protein
MLGRSGRQGTAPGSQSLPTDFAVLAYATLGKQQRLRMFRNELLSLCPWLTDRLAAAPHCYDAKQETVELVRVDLGGSSDHVARKCAAYLKDRMTIPAFASTVFQGQFRLVVITGTREKSAAIQQALKGHEWPPGLAIHLSVVPQLLSLTTRFRDA